MKNFKIFTDERGQLIPFEFDQLPFEPKRIFIVKDVPKGSTRGNHAHYNTQQFLVCLSGRIKVYTFNKFEHFKYIILTPGDSYLIPTMCWDNQTFMDDNSVLLVFCDTKYNKKDYITDYNKFCQIFKKSMYYGPPKNSK